MYKTTSCLPKVSVGALLFFVISCGDQLESAEARSKHHLFQSASESHDEEKSRRAVIDIARLEKGRGPRAVGADLDLYPSRLGLYLAPQEAWCSEFVAWAYKVAGRPFTRGEQGGWLLRDSISIKRWFTRQGRFVANGSDAWQQLEPRAGDYLRYNNKQGGHSGIIMGTNGVDLFTIEGNVDNAVVELVVKNWRQRADLDGIGRLY